MREPFEHLLARIRGEFIEMPGLRLSVAEASRLWGFEADLSVTILLELVDEGFLRVGADGKYRRPADCPPDADPRLARPSVRDERMVLRGRPGGRRAGGR